VGKLRYRSASIVVAVVVGTEVAASCLPVNVTDAKRVVHLNRAVSRSSYWPFGAGMTSVRA
jgi:hypothetical protein